MPVGLCVIRTAESVVLTDCPPGPAGAVDVDLQVVLVDLDVDVLGLRQHRDRRRGGVDAALGLGLGDALHAVRAALELEHGVRAVALDLERVGAVGGVHRVGREPAPLRVAREHAVEVARPQAGLLPARAAADLDDHVLVVVGVALDHREADLLLEALDPLARVVELRAHLGVLAALVEHLLRALGVRARQPPLLRELRGGRELVEQPAGVGVALAVRDHLGVRHLRLHVGVARLDLLDESFDHARKLTSASAAEGEQRRIRPALRALRR